MHFYLLLLCCLSVLTVSAQGEVLSIEPRLVNKTISISEFDEDFEDVTTVAVTNISRKTVQLVQERNDDNSPRAWSYGSSVRSSKRAPYLETVDAEDEATTLRPGETAIIMVYLRPDGIAGDGEVGLRFSDLTAPNRILGEATIRSTVRRIKGTGGSRASVGRPVPTTVGLYPNPAKDNFFVEAPRGQSIGRVEIMNTLGRTMRTFDRPAGEEGYNIKNLPNGLYLISVYDDKGKKVKTLRLLHRSFGA